MKLLTIPLELIVASGCASVTKGLNDTVLVNISNCS